MSAPTPPGSQQPGWYPDPFQRHGQRYWNGTAWTEHVADVEHGEQVVGFDAPLPAPDDARPAPPAAAAPVAPAGLAPPPPPPPTPPGGATAAAAGPPPPPPRSRAALVGAAAVVVLLFGTGIFVGVRWSSDRSAASGPRTATSVVGAGTRGTAVTGYLDLGTPTPPVTKTIGASGGTITAPSGASLEVPKGAFDKDLAITVTETPINGHSFGDWVTPASPLLSVDDGGVEAAQPITLRFPISVASGLVPLPVYYDRSAGTLEALPVSGIIDGALVAYTRHFSDVMVTTADEAAINKAIATTRAGGDPGLFGTSTTVGPSVPMLDSGFRPDVDGWQFVNYGSYSAPDGHCSGQSLTALWYYDNQALTGKPTLFGRFDDRVGATAYAATSSLQWDDRDAYRLASAVQHDEFNHWSMTYDNAMSKVAKDRYDTFQYYAFAYSIKLSGQPQYVGLYSNAGGGHAMIVYAVTPTSLLISDPNYPGEYRSIPWDAGHHVLGPYVSALNAAGQPIQFETIGYYAKSALVDWPTLGTRWQEFLDGKVGNDVFPATSLEVREVDDEGQEHWVPLVTGYKVKEDVATITVRMKTTAPDTLLRVYRWDNEVAISPSFDAPVEVPLEKGTNRLGFDQWAEPAGQTSMSWIDFSRLNVLRGEPNDPPLDLVFAIDLTSSMEDDIAGVKTAAKDIIQSVSTSSDNWRIAILGYRDTTDTPMFEDYSFSSDEATVISHIDALSVFGGDDEPEAVYEALMRVIKSDTIGGWRKGANKQIILMGDAPPHDPGSNGETAESVARAAFLADPVIVQAVVIGNGGVVSPDAQRTLEDIATRTGGSTFTAADAASVPAVLQQSIGATTAPTHTESSSKGSWTHTLVLVVSLVAMAAGAILLLRRLVLRRGARRWVAIGAAVLVIGVVGVGWWSVLDHRSNAPPAVSAIPAAPAGSSPAPTTTSG